MSGKEKTINVPQTISCHLTVRKITSNKNDDYWEAIKISGLSWLMGKLNRQVAVLSAAELAELAFINQVQSERSDLCTIGLKYACTKITKIIVVFSSARVFERTLFF